MVVRDIRMLAAAKKADASRLVVWGQTGFFAGVAACLLLYFDQRAVGTGLSYFSSTWPAALPYSLGLTIGALFSIKVAFIAGDIVLRNLLWLLAAFLILLAGTPYAISDSLKYIHTIVGSLLFLVQYALLIWLTLIVLRDEINLVLIFLSTITLFFTAFFLSTVFGYLLYGQLIFQLLFAITLYRNVKNLASAGKPARL